MEGAEMTKQSLEQRVLSGLNNANAGSDELAELVAETETAIANADVTATAMRLKAADVLAAPTPREAQDSLREAEAATLNHHRLNGILPQLRNHYAAAVATERQATWLGFYETAEAEREALAEEFNATRSRIKAELGSLNRRIKECNNDCNAVNNMAFEIGECRELELLPLFAALRTIDPDETSTGPDWQAANSFAAAYAQSMAPPTNPADWSKPEYQAARRAEAEKRQREMGAYYEQAGKDQETRQNAEERERFQQHRTP
jgi:hypothetical protein